MSLWLIRAGAHGEFETKFIADQKVYVTWDKLNLDLGKMASREALQEMLAEMYDESLPARLRNWVSQLWPFAHGMKKGDWIVLPSKTQRSTSARSRGSISLMRRRRRRAGTRAR